MTSHDGLPSYFHTHSSSAVVLPYGCAMLSLTLYAELFHFHLASHRRCILFSYKNYFFGLFAYVTENRFMSTFMSDGV